MDELPNGWHYRHHLAAYEFWWEGRKVHWVTDEAWEDFQAYLQTPDGKRWAHAIVSEAMGLVDA